MTKLNEMDTEIGRFTSDPVKDASWYAATIKFTDESEELSSLPHTNAAVSAGFLIMFINYEKAKEKAKRKRKAKQKSKRRAILGI